MILALYCREEDNCLICALAQQESFYSINVCSYWTLQLICLHPNLAQTSNVKCNNSHPVQCTIIKCSAKACLCREKTSKGPVLWYPIEFIII